jgi:hypothetical protein
MVLSTAQPYFPQLEKPGRTIQSRLLLHACLVFGDVAVASSERAAWAK